MSNKKHIFILAAGVLLIVIFGSLLMETSLAQDANDYFNPITYDSIREIIQAVMDRLREILVVLSVIFIIIGAVLYITSYGNDQHMETAKKAVTAAIIGLSIAVAAPTFLRDVSYILGWTRAPEEFPDVPPLAQIAINVLNFLLALIGMIAIIALIVGGIMYITSTGDEKKMEAGKKIFKFAIVGVTISLAGLILARLVVSFFAGVFGWV